MRAYEPGWFCVANHDTTGRRGLWARPSDEQRKPLPLGEEKETAMMELCAGREGDDASVLLQKGQSVTKRTLLDLEDVLARCAMQYEEHAMELADSLETVLRRVVAGDIAVATEQLKEWIASLRYAIPKTGAKE